MVIEVTIIVTITLERDDYELGAKIVNKGGE